MCGGWVEEGGIVFFRVSFGGIFFIFLLVFFVVLLEGVSLGRGRFIFVG